LPLIFCEIGLPVVVASPVPADVVPVAGRVVVDAFLLGWPWPRALVVSVGFPPPCVFAGFVVARGPPWGVGADLTRGLPRPFEGADVRWPPCALPWLVGATVVCVPPWVVGAVT
jgi:hypothetical protein